MKKGQKILAMLLAGVMALSMFGCGTTEQTASEAGDVTNESEDNILRTAASFAYPSLDVHKEYYGWYTSVYGLSEALFKLDENSTAVPCLAKDAVADGTTWTITLNDGVAFSNGEPLTADMVIRNIQRVAEVNGRFDIFGTFTYEAVDDKTIVVNTGDEVYPTLKSDLASPEFGMMDLDNTTDFDNDPICTGPFVITEFVPEGDVTVARNEKYWGGDVKLYGAVFYYMQEDDPKLLAMQSGEIDCYNSVSSAALEVYQAEPE
jgi:peptide/nickel transport system substrate-binding protein